MAVSVFALGALVLNALGTTIVLAAAAPSLLAARGAQLLLWVSLGLVPLALLGAAASVCVAVLCRTTKEAGTALRILVFLPMVVGMFLVFFPRWAARVWFLPIVGQQALLAIDDAFVQLAGGALLAVVTALAAAVPLAWAVRALNRDNVWTA
jgi:hypothetical protein